ncbi:MAG: hypothetical protein KJ698_05055, partial [Actinobacteria bacterium]|nr:hypothetical protein [Actinomycetota bacterium]
EMRSKQSYKTQQLCRQVERRLSLVLVGELEDAVLEGLAVVAVTPVAGPSILLVEVALPPGRESADAATVIERLSAASGYLRREIAAAISRKKTPQLTFRVVSHEPWDDEEPTGSRSVQSVVVSKGLVLWADRLDRKMPGRRLRCCTGPDWSRTRCAGQPSPTATARATTNG